MPEYVIKQGSIHDQFQSSKAKIQIMGGGFANGKTASGCVKALRLAQLYPGSNGLIGRATYPKLNDTIRREFFKWLPKEWIKSWSKSDNTLVLKNDSTINFRYVQQKGDTAGGNSSSNLLSATYDWILIDQMDDPEFDYKDFTDLLGRLRGMTKYVGPDGSMPMSGPRWFMITLNPTRNWIYRRVIKPVVAAQSGEGMTPELAEMLDAYGADNLADFIEVISGSTYENLHNLEGDYVRTLEATYKGTMRKRFLEGDWQGFSGLVYPEFRSNLHMVSPDMVKFWLYRERPPNVLEMYDHGIQAQSCYILAFVDKYNNVVCVDGFYEKEQPVGESVTRIRNIRAAWGISPNSVNQVYADPAIFRRSGGEYKTIGASVSDLFYNQGGIYMVRGNNDVMSGIAKVTAYLTPTPGHSNPFFGNDPAPFIYFNDETLSWVEEEITDYYFKGADNEDEVEDKPMDGKDHAMDAIKYGLTGRPTLYNYAPKPKIDLSFLREWHEEPDDNEQHGGQARGGRYGYGH